MRNLIIGVVVVGILALGTFYVLQGNYSKKTNSTSSSSTSNTNTTSNSSSQSNQTASDNVTITYSDSGFSPASATVKSGGKITWVNNSSGQLQIGSDPHPVHTGNRELTGNAFTLTLNAGEQKSVTVSKTGTFGYHNHLSPGDTGKVTVE